MDFHILGPLEAVADSGELTDLGRPRQRAVLAVLLISANRVMSLDRLIELLWDGEAPARATGALQAYISNLRRALEPAREARTPAQVLVTQAPGYILRILPDQLDAARFECLAARGRELLTAGRPAAARAALHQALSEWRGPALAEFASERFAHGEATRLEALRTVATENLLDADLQLGAHGAAVPELEAAVTQSPLRERLWGLLMVALYRSGRQADALRAYTRARRILGEQLGVEPSPALRELEADVLRQSPSLDWHPPAAEADETPPRVTAPPPAPEEPAPADDFVGRAPQLDALERALAHARAGRGRLVLLSGEAGIGKTRLAEELAARARARDLAVAWGRAYETEGAPPFWPWVQVVRSLLTQIEPAAVAAVLAGAAELAQLVPEVQELLGPGTSPASTDPGAARFRLYEAVADLLHLAGARRPVMVVLDDLHWADPLSVHLLAHLGERIDDARVLVVATYRHAAGADSGPVGDILGRLARLRTVARLTVPGLSPAEVGRYMAQAGGFEPTAEQVATVHFRTEGNPFFVAELARLLASEDLIGTEAVPAGVRDVVRRRLGRLPEQTRALLVVASAIGRDFDLQVVSAASQIDLDETVDLIEAAVATGVVAEDVTHPGRYRFSHALVRDTVYAQIGGLRRARVHGLVGTAIAALPDAEARTAELANHFFRAAVVDGPERGLAYALLAHDKARSSLAYEQAEAHLRRGLELVAMMPSGPQRVRSELRVQNRLAAVMTVADGFTAPTATGGWDRARELSDEVDDDTQGLASAWGQLSLSCVRAEVQATSRLARQLVQTGSRADQTAPLMMGHFGLGRAALFCGDLGEALARFSQARELCDSLDDQARLDVFGWLDPAVLCRVNTALVLGLLGEPAEAADWADAGAQVAERAGHPLSIGAALMFKSALGYLGGDGPLVHQHAEALHALASEHRLPDFVAAATIFRGWAVSQTGDAELGLSEITRGISTKRGSGFRMWQTVDFGVLADACRRAGLVDDALAALDDAMAEVEATGERFYEAELFRLRGELLLERCPTAADDARNWLGRAVDVATAQSAKPFRRRAEASLERLDPTRRETGPGLDRPTEGSILSPRERELLGLVARGLTDKDIAAELVISLATVRSHLDRIRDKTGRRRRPELSRLADDLGLTATRGPR